MTGHDEMCSELRVGVGVRAPDSVCAPVGRGLVVAVSAASIAPVGRIPVVAVGATSLADVAQTAERLTCNQQVAGSTPAVGSRRGVVATCSVSRGSSSVGRASAFQAERRGFDSRLPLCERPSAGGHDGAFAQVAQSAEHVLGKDEVGGSIPLLGLLNRVACSRVQLRSARVGSVSVGEERYPSGQREQTVNLPAYAFGGSNPPLSMHAESLRS